MTQMQDMSTAMGAELFQSVGVELTIFVITLALAAAFRGGPFGKTPCQKAFDASPAKGKQTDKNGVAPDTAGRSASPPGSRKPVKQSATSPQAPSPVRGLPRKLSSLIDCLGKRQQPAEAIAIYEEMRANGEHTSIKDAMKNDTKSADMFSMLVRCAGRVGRPELITLLLDDMTQAGIERSLSFYESSMKILASMKCYKEAMSVCSHLEADGLEPSPVTLSCLINFAVEIGEPDRAIGFFHRLSATSMPSIRAYMTILRVYSRRQDWPHSLALLRDMQKCEAPIDCLVLNIVLATGVAAGRLEEAQALLNEFSQTSMVDVISYNTVLKGFAQQKEVGMAIKLLDAMRQTRVFPNAITFNTVMDAAVRSSRVTDAWHVLKQMRDAGLAPDKFTCTTLMKGVQMGTTSEQLAVILDLLRNVTSECDSTQCGILFRSVIEAAAKVDDPALTARAVAQMREQRVMLSPQEYQRLMQVLLRGGEATRCSSVYHRTPIEAVRTTRVC